MWPFLFITIACGAISGFHSLVSSGTSAKQVRNENDALFVGYGSMLMEGALATLRSQLAAARREYETNQRLHDTNPATVARAELERTREALPEIRRGLTAGGSSSPKSLLKSTSCWSVSGDRPVMLSG
mgnify:CR=1 FL=1